MTMVVLALTACTAPIGVSPQTLTTPASITEARPTVTPLVTAPPRVTVSPPTVPSPTANMIPPGTPPCAAKDLVLTLVSGNGATGWEIEDWVITSRAILPCTVEGTPTARFVADGGAVVLASKDDHSLSEIILLPPGLPVAKPGEPVTPGRCDSPEGSPILVAQPITEGVY